MSAMTIRDWFRAAFARQRAGVTASQEESTRVGELELAGFQRRAAVRGLDIARTYGGVLLADAVGLGKTRVSSSIAKALARDARLRGGSSQVLICAPARLAAQWERAATRAGLAEFAIVTHTWLSRTPLDEVFEAHEPACVVVDEAHRFRNPRAKRSRALARLAAVAPVVLATATPVCNGLDDLYHLLSLFLADHDLRAVIGHNLSDAFGLAEAGLFDLTELVEQVVIRRTAAPQSGGFGRRPSVALEVLGYRAGAAEQWLWQNLEAEVRATNLVLFRDDWPPGLLVEYVLKRWESGADALLATLREMRAFHRRWLEADAHGRALSRASFRRLFEGEAERQQAVFPFLFEARSDERMRPQRREVEDDLAALERLVARAQEALRDGHGKWGAIVELARAREQKVLVFTSYQHAAHGLFEYLVGGLGAQAKVGLVTGSGARATGLGLASPQEVVRRFAPRSHGVVGMPDHQQLDVLVSTDCLAEGVNLQDCGHVVLADLPYSPLGVEQRIGRLVRPGGPHDRVKVYLPRPHSWNDSLGMRRRLDRKLARAADSGAAFVSAAKLGGNGESEKVGEIDGEPLAALTRFDALVERVGPRDESAQFDGFFQASCRRGPPRLWALVAIRDADATRYTWCLTRRGEQPEMRLHALLPQLAEDVEASGRVERAAPPEALLEATRAAISRRADLLRAARLAPFPLRLDSPQRALWHRLRDFENVERLDELQHALLRSFPRGTERRLAELAAADLPARRLVAQVRQIVGEAAWSPQVEVEIVGGLFVG